MFQLWVMDRLMTTDLTDLRGLCLDFGILIASSPLDFAVSFAALSASSLPSMSLCPGIGVSNSVVVIYLCQDK